MKNYNERTVAPFMEMKNERTVAPKSYLVVTRKFATKHEAWSRGNEIARKKMVALSSKTFFVRDSNACLTFTLKVIMLRKVHPRGRVKGLSSFIQKRRTFKIKLIIVIMLFHCHLVQGPF